MLLSYSGRSSKVQGAHDVPASTEAAVACRSLCFLLADVLLGVTLDLYEAPEVSLGPTTAPGTLDCSFEGAQLSATELTTALLPGACAAASPAPPTSQDAGAAPTALSSVIDASLLQVCQTFRRFSTMLAICDGCC
jgi:hypothetical protein